MQKWQPSVNVVDYSGPYPLNEIQHARFILIQCLRPPHSRGLARVLPKIGIDSCCGPGLVPPPPQPLPNGLTFDACISVPEKSVPVSPLPVIKSSSSCSAQSAPVRVSDWTPLVSRSLSLQDTTQSSVLQRHPQPGGSRDQPASVTKRRSSELLSTEDVPAKTARGNGPVVASRIAGQAGSAVIEKNIGEPSARSSNGTKLPPSHIYKCDYCRVTATSDAEMTSHLTRSKHASASEFRTASGGGDGSKPVPELQAIERMLAIINRDSSNAAALVIACPECRSIFDDIFTCATHSKYEHGESDGCYAICPVIQGEKVELGDPVCATCHQRFTDYNDVVAHWVAVPEHCPMPQSTDSRVFLVQTCPICKRAFNDDFLECVLHIAEEHRGTVPWLEVRHVMLPQRRERLPPFSTSRQSTGGLRDEATVLAKLQNCFEQNAINARLDQIQKILAGVA